MFKPSDAAKESPAKREAAQEPRIEKPRKIHWPAGVQFSKPEKLSCFVPEDLRVILTKDAFEQLFGYAYATSSEISCLGSVRREGNAFVVERFYLVKQDGSMAHTEMEPSAIAEMVEQLLSQGKADEARAIKCWAHSHPGMGIFWSKTDDNTCRLVASDYLVSLVVSDGFAVRCRIDVANPIPFTVDNVPVLCEMACDKEKLDNYAKEVAQKVKERSPFQAGPFGPEEKGQLIGNDPLSEYFGTAYSLFDGEDTAEMEAIRDDPDAFL